MDDFDTLLGELDVNDSDLIRLSHLNNKSSVLCPVSQDITSQYLALQQLDAHQRMIARAKSTVDASAPKSLQSYLSIADQQRTKSWRKQKSLSRESLMENGNLTAAQKLSRLGAAASDEDGMSLNASSVNKGIQTHVFLPQCMTDAKIGWYLEALSQGGLLHAASSQKSTSGVRAPRPVKGDLLDWHKKAFVQPKTQFSPRIVDHPTAQSKVKGMRCYNPPLRRRAKRSSSSHSSDTFESYDQEDDEMDEIEEENESSEVSSVEEDIPRQKPPSRSRPPLQPRNLEKGHRNENEDDMYLDFLNKVTEDILRSGMYSDRAVQQTFEFYMQFYNEEKEKEKLQSLLGQILEGLKISDDVSSEVKTRSPLLLSAENEEELLLSQHVHGLELPSPMTSDVTDAPELS